MHRKEVDDVAPPALHWYSKKGKGGNAEYVWEENALKQWLVVGSDQEIKSFWDALVSSQTLEIFRDIVFELPKARRRDSSSIHTIPGVNSCGRNQDFEEYECESWSTDVSFLLSEESNCAFLEGYKTDKKIQPMYPYGILGKGTLMKYLDRKVCAVFEQRGIYWSLSGNRKSVKDGSPEIYSGFVQADRGFKRAHNVLVRSLEGEKVLGEAEIDEASGKWSMKLIEPAGKGQFLIKRKDSGEIICGEKYYLISNISIKADIIHTVLTDIFDRKISIGSKSKVTAIERAIVWSAQAAPDSRRAQIELNDKIVSVLVTLGKKITISDPFFFGDFVESDAQLTMNASQRIFLNAISTAMATGGLEELVIVGYWSKGKNFVQGDKKAFLSRYEKVAKVLNQTFGESSQFRGLTKFEVVFSNELFHDRYWFGNGIIYHVSNSVNGSFESSEFTINPMDELAGRKLSDRLEKRVREGESHNLVSGR